MRNLAVGGSTVLDLRGQLDRIDSPPPPDSSSAPVVLSVGTNDAAKRRGVSLEDFTAGLGGVLTRLRGRPVAYLAPPGIIASRPAGERWTTARVSAYRDAALTVVREHAATVIRADRIVQPLGARAFADDGLHLSGLGYRTLLPHLAPRVWARVT
ncbi:SGNH/GDSL hydrolase family protein [Kytococcus sp. Marseille-QA3725]